MKTEEIFRERLRLLRIERGISQKKIAEGVGITEVGYRNYEAGRRKPTFAVFPAIADFFNVSTDYLLGRTDNPSRL
jgi:transcriptional regulator with XRE-family HTH domain